MAPETLDAFDLFEGDWPIISETERTASATGEQVMGVRTGTTYAYFLLGGYDEAASLDGCWKPPAIRRVGNGLTEQVKRVSCQKGAR
jgi:hypothetical protein